jgi:hypothetical protein
MTEKTAKVAPWETFTDGEWHTVRTGPADETRAESLRQYHRHYQSMRAWCVINHKAGQISRSENGRILRVRIRDDERSADRDRIVAVLRDRTRGQLGIALIEAIQILEYGLHLRQYGERAPGGGETWQEFDRRCEKFLRGIGA